MRDLREDAEKIIENIIKENLPGDAVKKALTNHKFETNEIYLIAIGKAAYTMAEAAKEFLGDRLKKGIVVTKYEHSKGSLENIEIYEAGHPVADENSVKATEKCIELAETLKATDELVFLVSGGGSAIFEKPSEGVTLDDIITVTNNLLKSSADIVEINMIRKRLSAVKAGRFAEIAAPAKIYAVILSDVLGDRLDSIASGPVVPDMSTVQDALNVVAKYDLGAPYNVLKNLEIETPKSITNVETAIVGSVKTLIESAYKSASNLGYTSYVLTNTLNCEAREAGRFLASITNDTLKGETHFERPCAIIAGGETVVTVTGQGKGGRNQEKALSFASGVAGGEGVLFFSLGSDGTDGPTDAAGAVVNGSTVSQLKEKNIDVAEVIKNNDSYEALKQVDSLIFTGPTGTNVNDVCVILID